MDSACQSLDEWRKAITTQDHGLQSETLPFRVCKTEPIHCVTPPPPQTFGGGGRGEGEGRAAILLNWQTVLFTRKGSTTQMQAASRAAKHISDHAGFTHTPSTSKEAIKAFQTLHFGSQGNVYMYVCVSDYSNFPSHLRLTKLLTWSRSGSNWENHVQSRSFSALAFRHKLCIKIRRLARNEPHLRASSLQAFETSTLFLFCFVCFSFLLLF